MLEASESWDFCRERQLAGNGNSPRENVLQSTKLKGVGDLKSTLTSDMEIRSLKFAKLVLCLGLVQYFLTMMLWNTNV